MTFTESIKTCFQKYFVFRGRAQRSEFWWWMLFTFVAGIVLSFVDSLLFPPGDINFEDYDTVMSGFWAGMASEKTPLTDIFNLATFFPGIAVGCRRLHDINRSGWWQISPILPALLMIPGFALIFGTDSMDPSALSIALIAIGVIAMLAMIAVLIVWWAKDSERTPNRFGASPKYDHVGDTFS